MQFREPCRTRIVAGRYSICNTFSTSFPIFLEKQSECDIAHHKDGQICPNSRTDLIHIQLRGSFGVPQDDGLLRSQFGFLFTFEVSSFPRSSRAAARSGFSDRATLNCSAAASV